MREEDLKILMLEDVKNNPYITKNITIDDIIVPKCNFSKEEIFVKINGIDRYGISTKGNVYGTHRKKFLKHDNSYSYPRVGIYYEFTQINEAVHRLVAIHFLDNPNNLPFVHHKDTNKFNPELENLEWTTNQINQQESVKANTARTSLTNQEAIDIFIISNKVTNSRCVKLGKAFNVNRNSIIELKAGRTRKYITKDIILKNYNKEDVLSILDKYSLQPSDII